MKKRMSVAALGLRMTWPGALSCILIASVLQLWSFYDSQWLWESNPVANVVDDCAAWAGYFKYAMMMAMALPLLTAKSRYEYTMNRLRVGEGETLAIWSAVFSGYFLLHWGVQLGLVLWMLREYAVQYPMTEMDWFLAVYRSQYIHVLMPHRDWSGYVRNIAMCISCGTLTAHIPWMLRHKKTWIGVLFLVAMIIYTPRNQGILGQDIFLSLIPVVLAVSLFLARKWVASDED